MLPICRPVIFVPRIQLVRTIHLSRFSQLVPAALDQKAMSHELSSKSMLDDQAFGGDLLNRSVGDRRDEKFVKNSFEGSSSLLISGRSVMAKQASGSNGSRQHTDLCWLSPQDFAEYGIRPQTDSQTSVTGESCVCSIHAVCMLQVLSKMHSTKHLAYIKICLVCKDQQAGALVPYLLGRTKQDTWSFAMDASAYSNQEQLQKVAKQKGTDHSSTFVPTVCLNKFCDLAVEPCTG